VEVVSYQAEEVSLEANRRLQGYVSNFALNKKGKERIVNQLLTSQ